MNRSEMSKRAWQAKRERTVQFRELDTLLTMFDLPHVVGYDRRGGADAAQYPFRLYEGARPYAIHYASDITGLREIVNNLITEQTCGV